MTPGWSLFCDCIAIDYGIFLGYFAVKACREEIQWFRAELKAHRENVALETQQREELSAEPPDQKAA
jgi:hypothetical protein